MQYVAAVTSQSIDYLMTDHVICQVCCLLAEISGVIETRPSQSLVIRLEIVVCGPMHSTAATADSTWAPIPRSSLHLCAFMPSFQGLLRATCNKQSSLSLNLYRSCQSTQSIADSTCLLFLLRIQTYLWRSHLSQL